jgi:hypothetical protein
MNEVEIASGLRRARLLGWAGFAALVAFSLFGVFAQDAWPATTRRVMFIGGITLGGFLIGYAVPRAASLRRTRTRLLREEYRRLAK